MEMLLWWGVCPGMRHGSVVDGQNLHRLLIGGNCQSIMRFKSPEIAYTEAFLGAQENTGTATRNLSMQEDWYT